jgi:hypothetical protein
LGADQVWCVPHVKRGGEAIPFIFLIRTNQYRPAGGLVIYWQAQQAQAAARRVTVGVGAAFSYAPIREPRCTLESDPDCRCAFIHHPVVAFISNKLTTFFSFKNRRHVIMISRAGRASSFSSIANDA